ncbi:MAG: LytTR family DNA-binding domain-containing protein [Saprospiraceae bacterium]|nr:LytTR family DNA-binding domain-containing protein [Saprospiraceae bacterium]
MKIILVDDEPKALELLTGYLDHFDSVELVGTFRNGLNALERISLGDIDLLFLDIHMPHISGITLSRMIPDQTRVIFTTAHAEFAVESYEVDAIDYLLKPISLERFSLAMSKALQPDKPNPGSSRILVKSGSTLHRIQIQDILYLEKDGNYMTYHCEGQKILARASVLEALRDLPDTFVQTHKSFVVNLDQVTRFDKDELVVGPRSIPMGSSFRNSVLKRLNDA